MVQPPFPIEKQPEDTTETEPVIVPDSVEVRDDNKILETEVRVGSSFDSGVDPFKEYPTLPSLKQEDEDEPLIVPNKMFPCLPGGTPMTYAVCNQTAFWAVTVVTRGRRDQYINLRGVRQTAF